MFNIRSTLTRIAAIVVVAFSIVGCQAISATDDAIDAVTASEQFQKICQIAPLAHNAFVVLASHTSISATIVERERQAYEVVRITCQRRPANIIQALSTIREAYLIILNTQETVTRREISNG